jgi:hypothetical protein
MVNDSFLQRPFSTQSERSTHVLCSCRRSPGLGVDQDLESAVDHALEIEEHGFLITHRRDARAFLTLALTRSRCARDLNAIQENTTVSPGLALADRVNGTPNLTLRSSPAHSRYSRAPCSVRFFPPSWPCGGRLPGFFRDGQDISVDVPHVNPPLWLRLQP